MENKYSEATRVSFYRKATKNWHEIVNVLWPWTLEAAVSDLANMASAAIKLEGLDPKTTKEFTKEEIMILSEQLEAFRRLEMKAEAREVLVRTLAEHGITIEIPEVMD